MNTLINTNGINKPGLYPNAYLKKTIVRWFIDELERGFELKDNAVMDRNAKKNHLGFLQPSKLRTRMDSIFSTLSRLDQALNLEMHGVVKRVLSEQFTVRELDRTQPIAEENYSALIRMNPMESNKLIDNVCGYYSALLDHAFVDGVSGCKLKAVYSSHAQSWIDRSDGTVVGESLQNFCSIKELTALIPIIGAHGVRSLDHSMLREIAHSMFELTQTVRDPKYQKLYRRVCEQGIDDVKHVHFLMTNGNAKKLIHIFNRHGMRIGAFVQFRKLLKQSLHRVCDQRANFEWNTVEVLQRALDVHDYDPAGARPSVHGEEALHKSLTVMLSQFGIEDEGTMVLQALKGMFSTEDAQQNGIISNLPMFMSVCMLSQDFWNRHGYGRYEVDVANFNNNGMALAETVHFLFGVFMNTEADKAVREQKLKWLRTASYLVTELLNCTKNMEENVMGFVKYSHGAELLLFLHNFVDLDQVHLDEGDLDDLFVADMIRAEMVRVYGANSSFTTSKLYVDSSDEEAAGGSMMAKKSSSFSNAK